MSIKQNNSTVSVCITGDIDYFEIETVEDCLSPLLGILQKYNAKMTIPITAKAVKDHPERAEYVLKQGHEVAVHGDVHQAFYGSVEEQVDRLEKAKRIFRESLGFIPGGFRAPQLKHDKNTYLALIEADFLYDSSQGRNEVIFRLPMITGLAYDLAVFPVAKPFLGFAASLKSRQIPAKPFLLHNQLVELPLTGPDDWHLILSKKGPRYSPGQARRIADIWLDIVQDMKRRSNRLYVIQAHPYIMSPLYNEAIDVFLESVSNDNKVELKLLGDVARSFLSQNKAAGNRVS